jgi:hypothetical protein
MTAMSVPRPVAAAGLALALVLALPSTALPCSCSKPRDFAELYGWGDAIFEGEVVSIQFVDVQTLVDGPDGRPNPYAQTLQHTRFRVLRYWKGPRDEFIVIRTSASDAGMCGWRFEPGQRLRVIAHRDSDGVWSTGYCSMMPIHYFFDQHWGAFKELERKPGR